MTHIFPALVLTILVAGCGSYSHQSGSVAYSDGFHNGCMHGTALDGPFVAARDDRQYFGDADYRTGWRQGHSECANKSLSRPGTESWHP